MSTYRRIRVAIYYPASAQFYTHPQVDRNLDKSDDCCALYKSDQQRMLIADPPCSITLTGKVANYTKRPFVAGGAVLE